MKNILLAVTGLSPQVITETLFALHQQNKTIDTIHIITTRQGKEKINAHLLSPKDGKYYQYLKEYGIDSATIDFGFGNVHTIKDSNGIEIDDIEGEEKRRTRHDARKACHLRLFCVAKERLQKRGNILPGVYGLFPGHPGYL